MDFDKKFSNDHAQSVQRDVDAGLRNYMLAVYNYMAMGLGLTGVVAFIAASSEALQAVLFSFPLAFVVMGAPLVMVLLISFRYQKMKFSTLQTMFWSYAGLMGLSLSAIFQVYTGTSIARVFFITAGTFGAMSLYGYTTKKDLTTMGSFLIMGLIGICIASLVNLFLSSPALSFITSLLGVFIFIGLTAYDTQRIKLSYVEGNDNESAGRSAIMGALTLYLDFINLFIFLLRFIGDRR